MPTLAWPPTPDSGPSANTTFTLSDSSDLKIVVTQSIADSDSRLGYVDGDSAKETDSDEVSYDEPGWPSSPYETATFHVKKSALKEHAA
ncbi:hypothetical protein N7457_003125 [Penicillium paradoxum]|uniref:uncharacterized protein n=1 Tax=Penicillium paradoxum TaxID=176176 RepID=UPI00254879E5|nr:uncharacterized protein N7457_003125 [Penicillium paradoxum]KAJ5788135.1 hypothetical protein N7457_003125 [Penicillium paradoxum]